MLSVPERDARALVPFLDGGVFLHLHTAATYDTNLFANADEEGDFYLSLVPELQYLRAAGLLSLDVRAGVEFVHFLDFADQDTQDFFSSVAFSYPNRSGDDPRKIVLDVGWRQKSATNVLLGTRVQSEILSGVLSGRRHVSERLGLRAGANYSNEQFDEGRFSEIDIWSVSADAIHIYSENLETFVGYRYRHTETAGAGRAALAADDHLVQGGLEGQLTARMVGAVSAGLQGRFFDQEDLEDRVQPYGSVSVTWTPRARSELTLEGLKDFAVTPDDRSVDRTAVHLILKQGVYGGFSLEPMAGYTHYQLDRPDDRSRDEQVYEAGIGFLYDLAGGASAALHYTFQNQDSEDPFFQYNRHIIELSAGISF